MSSSDGHVGESTPLKSSTCANTASAHAPDGATARTDESISTDAVPTQRLAGVDIERAADEQAADALLLCASRAHSGTWAAHSRIGNVSAESSQPQEPLS